MIFKSKFGMIKGDYLMLNELNSEMIILSTITEMKINERQSKGLSFVNYFKKKEYDFTIMLEGKPDVTFTFSKKHLSKALKFKIRIQHTRFSLQEAIPQHHDDTIAIE